MSIKKEIKISDLNQRIKLTCIGEKERDSEGNVRFKPGKTIEVWACVEAYTAQSADKNGEQVNEVRYFIAIRYRNDVTKETAIEYDDKKLSNLIPPVATNRKKWLQMDCREVTT